jgi:hypothetical protein
MRCLPDLVHHAQVLLVCLVELMDAVPYVR